MIRPPKYEKYPSDEQFSIWKSNYDELRAFKKAGLTEIKLEDPRTGQLKPVSIDEAIGVLEKVFRNFRRYELIEADERLGY